MSKLKQLGGRGENYSAIISGIFFFFFFWEDIFFCDFGKSSEAGAGSLFQSPRLPGYFVYMNDISKFSTYFDFAQILHVDTWNSFQNFMNILREKIGAGQQYG